MIIKQAFDDSRNRRMSFCEFADTLLEGGGERDKQFYDMLDRRLERENLLWLIGMIRREAAKKIKQAEECNE